MKVLWRLLKAVFGGLSVRKLNKAKKLSKTEEGRKSIKYGVTSIVLALVSLALVYPCLYVGLLVFQAAITTNLAIIGNIFALGLGVALFVLPIRCAISALSYSVYQIKVNNKRAFSWVTLGLALLAIVGTVILFIVIGLTAFNGK